MVVFTKGNTMTMQKKRGFLAAASAALTVLALSFGGAASAALNTPANPPETSDVTITKLTQPDAVGAPADGGVHDPLPAGAEGIGGVTFDYYLVPGTNAGQPNDVGTNAGQAWAAQQTVTTLAGLLPASATGSFPETAASGVTTVEALPRGLYVVRERIVPAGVTPAADFVLAVPLTDSDNRSAWLEHIYIYPKNSKIAGSKSVVDGEGANSNYVVGGKVTWTIKAEIPRVANDAAGATTRYKATDAFEIRDTLVDEQLTTTVDGITVTAPAGLEKGDDKDYTVTPVTEDDETTWTIAFTETGLGKLAAAVNADVSAEVVIEFVTTVQSVGTITNEASIYPDQASITDENPLETGGATIKYGNYQIVKKSSDNALTGDSLAGAEFKVYLTKDDALAGTNAVSTKENSAGLWTTTSGGTVTVGGLRYTNWADGETVEDGTPKSQTYWLVETKALAGHQLLGEPIEFVVDDNSATQNSQEIINAKTSGGGFELPLTGGTGTAMLTIGGILLLAVVLIVARRRRVDEIV